MFLCDLIDNLKFLEQTLGGHAEVYIKIDQNEVEVFGVTPRLREEDGEYDVIIE